MLLLLLLLLLLEVLLELGLGCANPFGGGSANNPDGKVADNGVDLFDEIPSPFICWFSSVLGVDVVVWLLLLLLPFLPVSSALSVLALSSLLLLLLLLPSLLLLLLLFGFK